MDAAKLLVVDDEEAIRNSLLEYLTWRGYESIQAENISQALELARKLRPDAVLSDLMMPGGTGLSLFQQLRELQAPGWDPCFILMTGHASLQTALEALRLGVDDYLLKPVQPEDLTSVLNSALARHRLRGQDRISVQSGLAREFYQELWSPLNLLRTYLDMFEQGTFGYLSGLQKEKHALMRQATQQILFTLRRFPDRVLKGGDGQGREALDAPALLEEVLGRFHLDFERRGGSILAARPAGLPRAWCRAAEARRVLEGLVGQCLLQCRPGAALRISWRRGEGGLVLEMKLDPCGPGAEAAPLEAAGFGDGLTLKAGAPPGEWEVVFEEAAGE